MLKLVYSSYLLLYRAFDWHLAQLLPDQIFEYEVVAVVVNFLELTNSYNAQLSRAIPMGFLCLPSDESSGQLITAAVRRCTYQQLHFIRFAPAPLFCNININITVIIFLECLIKITYFEHFVDKAYDCVRLASARWSLNEVQSGLFVLNYGRRFVDHRLLCNIVRLE